MGGPLSPLTWTMAFDPIVWISQMASCSGALAYVDDMLSLIFGPGQLILTYLVLLVATKMAGLVVEEHTCAQISCSQGQDAARVFLLAFPTGFETGPNDSFRFIWGPTELYLE